MKNNSSKAERQLAILDELYDAQEKEYVIYLELELEKLDSKIIYEPIWQMYRNNELAETTQVVKENLKDCPNYSKLRATFCSTVDQKKLNKIAKYASMKYSCKYIISENRITFFEF